MKYKVKKLFHGCASIRDYIIEKCIKNQEGLTIFFNEKEMLVPLDKLKNCYQIHKTKFQSKFGNSQYELYDFPFKPDSKEKQMELF